MIAGLSGISHDCHTLKNIPGITKNTISQDLHDCSGLCKNCQEHLMAWETSQDSDDLMISGLLWICQDLMIVMTVMTVKNTHASHDLWSMIYDLMTPLNVSWLLQDILNTQDSYDSYDCQEWSGISLECLGFLGFQEHFKTKDSIRLSGVWHGSQDSWWLSMIAMTARRISRPMISRLPWIGHDSYDCQEDLRASMISRLAWRSQDSYDCREYAMGLRNIPWVSYTLEW
jgi:hypothetical protein